MLARGIVIALFVSAMTLTSLALAQGAESAPATAETDDDTVEPPEGRDVAVQSATTDQGVEEILVTATRREQSLQEVNAAVSAFTGADLDEAGIYQMQDLAFQVPNVHYGQEQGLAQITIRGVSTGFLSDQSTAFHVDGVYQNDPRVATALTFYDLRRVEVLRGPQGTLYGRNATGGAINVISAPPSFDFGLFGDVQIGTYHQVLARGVVNVPLVTDRLALRLSTYYDGRDGYQKNAYRPGPVDDANDADDFGLRAQLLWQPLEDLDVTLRFNYFRKGGVGFALKRVGPNPDSVDILSPLPPFPINMGALPNPADVRRVVLDTQGMIDQTNIGGNVELQYLIEPISAQLKVLGSYVQRDSFQRADQDATNLPTASSNALDDNREWVAEANLVSQADSDWDWVVGLFTFGTQASLDLFIPTNITTPDLFNNVVVSLDTESHFQFNTYSAAAYGQIGYRITEDLRLEVGLRYSHDWKDAARQSPYTVLPIPAPPPPGRTVDIPIFVAIDDYESDDWGRVSGALSLDYEVLGAQLLYGKFSTGYKAGTVQNDIPLVGAGIFGGNEPVFEVPEVAPEDIFALEFGLKTTWLDNHMRANFTVFNYWYSNLQVSQLVESWFVLENAADATTFGAEFEFFYMPWDSLTLIANFAYLDATFVSFPGCISAEDPTNPLDCTGNVLPRSPRFSGSFVAQYDFDLGRFGELSPRLQVYASDEVYFRATNLEIDRQPAYALLNVRLMWRSADASVSIEGFIDNITDEDVASTKVVGSSLLGAPVYTSYDRPRTAGIRVGLNW